MEFEVKMPNSASEVTESWLLTMLQYYHKTKDVKINTCEIEPFTEYFGFVSSFIKAHIVYQIESEYFEVSISKDVHLLIKLPVVVAKAFTAESLEQMRLDVHECHFYNDILRVANDTIDRLASKEDAPKLKYKVPTHYYAASNAASSRSVIVLENLEYDGFERPKGFGNTIYTDDEFERVIDEVAKIHAVGYAIKDNPIVIKYINDIVKSFFLNETVFKGFMDQIKGFATYSRGIIIKEIEEMEIGVDKEAFLKWLDDSQNMMEAFIESDMVAYINEESPLKTMAQGDYHCANIMLKTTPGDKDIRILDWQFYGFDYPFSDLIFNCLIPTEPDDIMKRLREVKGKWLTAVNKYITMLPGIQPIKDDDYVEEKFRLCTQMKLCGISVMLKFYPPAFYQSCIRQYVILFKHRQELDLES